MTAPRISATFWQNATPGHGCIVTTEGELGQVKIQIEKRGDYWELVLDSDDARQLIFSLHRTILDALQRGNGYEDSARGKGIAK